MEILGLPLQDFIFSIFLPFIFFYLLLYALLRKSKILGEPKEANKLNTMISLVISALGIFSLYSLGLAAYLPYLAAFAAVAAFVTLFLFGTFEYGSKKMTSYVSGDAFKTEDERKFDAGVKSCKSIWAAYKEKGDEKSLKQMVEEVSKLEQLAQKLGKGLYEFGWYKEYKDLIAEVGKRSR
jgi:predicted membrane channel-forming protein YqfA (hemolysin III family)